MIFSQFVIFVLIYDYLKFREDSSFTSQEIMNYISVALAVALSVDSPITHSWFMLYLAGNPYRFCLHAAHKVYTRDMSRCIC